MNCPNCDSNDLEDFYVIKDAPVQSIVTIKSYKKAIEIPRKDILLTFCNSCGFIFNRLFDTSIDFYSKGYEDQQSFSPTFESFISEVANNMIEKYDIRGKNIVEIGCGKGDFLKLICKLGNNKGVGIGPSVVPGRSESDPDVFFVKEYYSEEHGEFPCDVIICRHTLEHIFETSKFVEIIRRSANKNSDIFFLIEVPNVVRILQIQAFWDIFYEHCSYFSMGSLARMLRINSFEILDIFLEYDNQYILMEVKPTEETSIYVHPSEETIEQLKEYIGEFVTKINIQIKKWKEKLVELKDSNKKVAMWGGGSKAVGFLTQFDGLKVIKHVVDINPNIHGNFIPGVGIQYVPPVFMKEFDPDTIIVMNGIYEDEIRTILAEMDLYPELICL